MRQHTETCDMDLDCVCTPTRVRHKSCGRGYMVFLDDRFIGFVEAFSFYSLRRDVKRWRAWDAKGDPIADFAEGEPYRTRLAATSQLIRSQL